MADTRNRSEKHRPSWFWALAVFTVPGLRFSTRLHIRNPEKLPDTGAYIMAPNHFSNIDPLITAYAAWRLGRAPRFLAKASLFRIPIAGWLLAKSGQIPVERGGRQSGAVPLKSAQELVESGRGVIVYPEGSLTRDPDLWPMRGKSGAARLALETGLAVIPVAHWGTQHLMARYSKKVRLFPPTHIDVVFGDPVDLSAWAGRAHDKVALQEATDVIMAAITALVAQLRDEVPPDQRWDPRKHDQSETGRF